MLRQSITIMTKTLQHMEKVSGDICSVSGDPATRQNLRHLIQCLSLGSWTSDGKMEWFCLKNVPGSLATDDDKRVVERRPGVESSSSRGSVGSGGGTRALKTHRSSVAIFNQLGVSQLEPRLESRRARRRILPPIRARRIRRGRPPRPPPPRARSRAPRAEAARPRGSSPRQPRSWRRWRRPAAAPASARRRGDRHAARAPAYASPAVAPSRNPTLKPSCTVAFLPSSTPSR